MKKLYFIIFLISLFYSCKKTEYLSYSDIDRIQFGPSDPLLIYRSDYETVWKYKDTLKSYSFYYDSESIRQDTLYFDIYTLGMVANYDRSYTLRQTIVESDNNAQPNIHYQSFDDPKSEKIYVIKAGQVHAKVPVILYRDPTLKEKEYILNIEIVENQNFSLGPITNVWRKVIISDRLTRPTAWTDSAVKYWWGKYSAVKHQFMIEVTHQKWDQEMMSSLAQDESSYWLTELKKALADYNNAHSNTPLLDEDQELVVFP